VAAQKLEESYNESLRGGIQSYTLRTRLYQALAAPTSSAAIPFLADALKMAEPEGYIRTFVDEGRLLAPLLKAAVSQGICPDYATKLLDVIQDEQRTARLGQAPILSPREQEMLRLLARGLSSLDISRKLMISSSTARSHIRHVLEKLDSRSTLQAVSRARELKLIPYPVEC
jgi:LuxR family maltose regulon positive regulatory protein